MTLTAARNTSHHQQIIKVDMRGQVCPSTLLVALAKINQHRQELQSGEIKLCIMTDNREAITTIPATAQNMGYYTTVTKEKAYYEICISLLPQEAA